MTPGRSAEVARRYAPALVGAQPTERPITVDQSNDSVIVDELVVVKWLVPPQPLPHTGVTLLSHLTEVGFDEMPAFIGAHVENGTVIAMLTAFVPGALDGWDWYVDELTAALDAGSIDVPNESARRIGALAARLHDALGTASRVIPHPADRASMAAERDRGRQLLAEAMSATTGDVGARLRARADRISDTLGVLDETSIVAVQPLHGDLHVGQLLRTADTILVNDFDGNPIGDPAAGGAFRSPLVDLAALLQSIDHVGRIVQKRRPDDREAIEAWIGDGIAIALDAYSAIKTVSVADLPTLLALRVIQELHELMYAAHALPAWLYVPDGALTAMFPVA